MRSTILTIALLLLASITYSQTATIEKSQAEMIYDTIPSVAPCTYCSEMIFVMADTSEYRWDGDSWELWDNGVRWSLEQDSIRVGYKFGIEYARDTIRTPGSGGGGGGTVNAVVAGDNVSVDASDPANPVVSVPSIPADDVTIIDAGDLYVATDVEGALQEEAINRLALDAIVGNVISLTGMPVTSTSFGTFTGSILPDNQTAKSLYQTIENNLQAHLDSIAALRGDIGSGILESIVAGAGISVDDTDPTNPIVINTSPSLWLLNGSKIYYNTNNVGIGVSNPILKFEVAGDIAGIVTGGSPRFLLGEGYSTGQFGGFKWNEASNTISFGATGSIAAVYADPNNNVGIGTTTITHKMNISTPSGIVIGAGTSSQRGTLTQGYLNFNNELQTLDVGRFDAFANTALYTSTPTNMDILVKSATLADPWRMSRSITTGISIPRGTTAQRPVGELAMLRYNTTTGAYEGHNGTSFGRLYLNSDVSPTNGQVGVFNSTTGLYEPTTLSTGTMSSFNLESDDFTLYSIEDGDDVSLLGENGIATRDGAVPGEVKFGLNLELIPVNASLDGDEYFLHYDALNAAEYQTDIDDIKDYINDGVVTVGTATTNRPLMWPSSGSAAESFPMEVTGSTTRFTQQTSVQIPTGATAFAGAPADGSMRYDSDTDQFKLRIAGVYEDAATEDYVDTAVEDAEPDVAYTEDTDLAIFPDKTVEFVTLNTTSSAVSDTNLSLPTASSSYGGFQIVVWSIDSSGSFGNTVSASTIQNGVSTGSSISLSNFQSTTISCIQINSSGSYRWVVTNQY